MLHLETELSFQYRTEKRKSSHFIRTRLCVLKRWCLPPQVVSLAVSALRKGKQAGTMTSCSSGALLKRGVALRFRAHSLKGRRTLSLSWSLVSSSFSRLHVPFWSLQAHKGLAPTKPYREVPSIIDKAVHKAWLIGPSSGQRQLFIELINCPHQSWTQQKDISTSRPLTPSWASFIAKEAFSVATLLSAAPLP